MTGHQTGGPAFAEIDPLQARRLAESIARFGFDFDRFDDPLLYPGVGVDPSRAALFFFFIVAIDHRTHPQGKTYGGKVGGVGLTGSELMYALAKRRFDEDPAFFSPERMSRISTQEVADLFRVPKPEIMDIAGAEERASLLRDCAIRLRQVFQGSALNLISASGGYLLRGDGNGLLQLLKMFDAYSDSLSKKSFLLVKFLERRHLLSLKDPQNLHVPVDSILQRLALRTGIVKLTDENLDRKIRGDEQVTPSEEEAIRKATMSAFDEVAKASSLTAAYLDDILWEFGRLHCRLADPLCDRLPTPEMRRAYRIINSGPIGECPFGPGCEAYRDSVKWNLKEPSFKTSFY